MARDALPEWQCTIAGRHYSKMIYASYAVYNFQREHGVVREQEQDIANIPIQSAVANCLQSNASKDPVPQYLCTVCIANLTVGDGESIDSTTLVAGFGQAYHIEDSMMPQGEPYTVDCLV